MGLIDRTFGLLFGSGNVVAQTAEVFRENAEKAGARRADLSAAALAQFSGEFAAPARGWFDRFMDGLNRVPRPALALGTVGLFVAAMVDPIWFSSRMVGLALVPEPLWWLLGAIVSFYFGARHQVKGQEFQRSIAESLAHTPQVAASLETLRKLAPADEKESDREPSTQPIVSQTAPEPFQRSAEPANLPAQDPQGNAALADWRTTRG